MTPQQIVFYLGLVAFGVAAVMAAWAAYTFFALDVRGVMDDLSGRRRATGQAGQARRTGRRGAAQRRGTASAAEAEVPDAPLEVRMTDDEDNVETVVDAALRPVALPTEQVNSDKTRGSAYKSAAQGTSGAYHSNDRPIASGQAETPTMVDGEDDYPTTIDGVASRPAFVVTRRVVLIHSDEVISAG